MLVSRALCLKSKQLPTIVNNMFALIVFLFVQNNLDVGLVNTMNYGVYDETSCKANAVIETHTLPLQPGNVARWQYATCVKVLS